MNTEKIVCTIILLLMTIGLTGCVGTKLYVANDRHPFKISNRSAFVTKSDLIKLIDGEEIEYYNSVKDKYYLPPTYIEIIEKDGKEYIKMKVEE